MANRGDGVAAMGEPGRPVVDLGVGRRAMAIAAASSATCALLDGGSVKCWGDSYQGALGYGDIATRGATPGTMGDALREVDLGSRDGAPLERRADRGDRLSQLLRDHRRYWPGRERAQMLGKQRLLRARHRHPTRRPGERSIDNRERLAMDRPREDRGGGDPQGGGCSRWVPVHLRAGRRRRDRVLGRQLVADSWVSERPARPARVCPRRPVARTLVPLPAPAVALGARGQSAGGGAHACALLASRQVTCWGENDSGQLGTGDTVPLDDAIRRARVRRGVHSRQVGAGHRPQLRDFRGWRREVLGKQPARVSSASRCRAIGCCDRPRSRCRGDTP